MSGNHFIRLIGQLMQHNEPVNDQAEEPMYSSAVMQMLSSVFIYVHYFFNGPKHLVNANIEWVASLIGRLPFRVYVLGDGQTPDTTDSINVTHYDLTSMGLDGVSIDVVRFTGVTHVYLSTVMTIITAVSTLIDEYLPSEWSELQIPSFMLALSTILKPRVDANLSDI